MKPQDLLAEAKKIAPKKPKKTPLWRYGEAIDVLRGNGMKWHEIQKWLKSKGISYTEPHILQAHQQWLKSRKRVPKAA